jgi:hypothetical protein
MGFECLKSINLEKKIIMGNHDIIDSFDKGCSVLKSQLKLPWYDVKFPFSFDFYYIHDNSSYETILMIYLDTTLYDTYNNDENTCYLTVINKNISTLKEEQNNFIKNTIKIAIDKPIYNIKKIMFFGHEPLLTYKEKKKIQKPLINEELLNLLFEEKNKYLDLNFSWICADYHVYQNTEIVDLQSGNKINQWIFGTGGGSLDSLGTTNIFMHLDKFQVNILPNIVYNSNEQDISSEFTTYGVNKYGYGDININMSSITHKFIISDFDYTDIKIKYLKYKNKYINLKNNNLK